MTAASHRNARSQDTQSEQCFLHVRLTRERDEVARNQRQTFAPASHESETQSLENQHGSPA
jgi:hypothetical protein